MKKITIIFCFISTLAYCQQRKDKSNSPVFFEKSLKEQKDKGTITEYIEHFDSIKNVYSNFKYRIAFDAPDHWKSDGGVSEHTIFRIYEADSAINFHINVIEIKLTKEEKKEMGKLNLWELYQNNKEKMDHFYKVILPKKYNTEIKDYKVKKSYLKNQVAIKRSYNHIVRQLDYEYSLTSIVYQTSIDNLTYTFGLDVPTTFYDENPEYYENLFLNISFLLNKEDLNKYLNQK